MSYHFDSKWETTDCKDVIFSCNLKKEKGAQCGQNKVEEMSMLQLAFHFKGGLDSVETCLKMKH